MERATSLVTFKGHKRSVMSVTTIYDEVKDKRYVVSIGLDKVVKVWDYDRGKCVKTLRGH